MKKRQLIKHILTGVLSLALLAGLIQLLFLDVASEHFGWNILTGTYFSFLFIILAVYRIHWIGTTKTDWIALLLCIGTVSLLSVMILAPENIFALWKITLAFFVILTGYTILQKVNTTGWLAIVTKLLVLISCALFVVAPFFRIATPAYYEIAFYTLFITTFVALIGVFLPKNH